VAAYYNEIDPFAAQWLRNLIAAGHIAPGIVDERSIKDVAPEDLRPYVQCHFFAGIGVWSHALRLAGWPDDRPVWTGSCPCQPFSSAGVRLGTADERHLWPDWFNLIRQRRPSVIFGEQVEAAINHGWLDLVQADLESEDYACGAVGMPAAGVGAPHIRQRLWFVANNNNKRREWDSRIGRDAERRVEHAGDAGELADANGTRSAAWVSESNDGEKRDAGISDNSSGQKFSARFRPENFWSDCDWLPCRDGKARPVEPGTFPLAHGTTARVGRLRAYGNAIVPQVAQALIEAYLSCN
jgi:DNA (cytosine-5)-methyltransferase 1